MKGRERERGIVPHCQNENLATLVNCAKFLATKPLTINQLSLSENALKFTCGNVDFLNFQRRTSALRGRNETWRGGKIGRKKRDGEGRGWGCRGRKGKAKRKGRDGKTKKDRGEKGRGTRKRKLDLRSSR
jgi:hypothetical protein